MGRSKKVPHPTKTSILNPAGVWDVVDKNDNSPKATFGEQEIGHYFNEAEFFIVEGPSGAGGHSSAGNGFDGIAFNPRTKELIVYDNKATKATGVSKVTALKENLVGELEKSITRIEARQATEFKIPHGDKILEGLKDALKAANSGGAGWPKNVKLYVYGVSGRASHLNPKLIKEVKKAGLPLEFKSFEEMQKARVPAIRRAEARREVARLQEFVIREEPKAARAVVKRSKLAAKITGKAGAFIEKRLPKLIAESVLKGSAKAAAKRAASLVPVVGWAYDAQDAYKGVEDIFRGHVARGIAGIGLSIADAGSDFLHIGDAVTGVGGTALSIGAQVGIMVGQVKIEMDRKEEKMRAIADEVDKLGALPPDERLRNEFGLDDDEIADFKREYDKPESGPEEEPDLPELPPDIPERAPQIPPLDEPPPDEPPMTSPPQRHDRVGDPPAPPKPRPLTPFAPDEGQMREKIEPVPRSFPCV